jgi:transcriptional regulator with XRE-family HTH domain
MEKGKNIQQIIAEAVRQQGYRTVKEAARATGLSAKTLQSAISGASTPSPQTLIKLATRLGLDADDLVRRALRAKAVGEKFLPQQKFFDDWDLVISRARNLGPDVEKDLLAHCDSYLRGAEVGKKSHARKPGSK